MADSIGHKRIFGLDLMRAVAISLVLVGHCAWIFPAGVGALSQLFGFSAYIGVEIFFVLSGFLIGTILFNLFTSTAFGWDEIKLFLKRRWFRTLPNYYLILVVNIIIALVIGYETESLWRYFFFLQNFADPMLPFFTESWSLSIEEFSYIVLPLALFLGGKMMRNRLRSAFVVIVAALSLVFLLTKMYHYNVSPSTTIDDWNLSIKSVVIFRIDAILIGVIYAWLAAVHQQLWFRLRMFAALLGVIGVGFFLVGIGYFGLLIESYPFFWDVFYLPLTSVVIGLFLPLLSQWNSPSKVVAVPITFISKISYSLYLVHYGIVLQILRYIIPPDKLTFLGIILFATLYFGLTFLLSTLLYKFYEKPMTDLRDKVVI